MQMMQQEPKFTCGSGRKEWDIYQRWNLLGLNISGCTVQPLSPWKARDPVTCNASGCHWLLCVFVNLDTIVWQTHKETVGHARVLVFDSLKAVVTDEQMGLLKEAFQLLIARAGSDQHKVPMDMSRTLAAQIPWELVRHHLLSQTKTSLRLQIY